MCIGWPCVSRPLVTGLEKRGARYAACAVTAEDGALGKMEPSLNISTEAARKAAARHRRRRLAVLAAGGVVAAVLAGWAATQSPETWARAW